MLFQSIFLFLCHRVMQSGRLGIFDVHLDVSSRWAASLEIKAFPSFEVRRDQGPQGDANTLVNMASYP